MSKWGSVLKFFYSLAWEPLKKKNPEYLSHIPNEFSIAIAVVGTQVPMLSNLLR